MTERTEPVGTVWRPDMLAGFEATDLLLPTARPAVGEPADTELLATLVSRVPVGTSRSAVLYVHGWNDYFFQAHLAA